MNKEHRYQMSKVSPQCPDCLGPHRRPFSGISSSRSCCIATIDGGLLGLPGLPTEGYALSRGDIHYPRNVLIDFAGKVSPNVG